MRPTTSIPLWWRNLLVCPLFIKQTILAILECIRPCLFSKCNTEKQDDVMTITWITIFVHYCSASCAQETPCVLLCVQGSSTPRDDLPPFSGDVSSSLWVSVPRKRDVGHWTAWHSTATTQPWWTCLRQGPEREFNVRRQWEEAPVLPFREKQGLNRYRIYIAIIRGCLLRGSGYFFSVT